MMMIDNPTMCPGTGHRICNDCMKACIYQKQEPVNIPQIETRILTDVLELPWGFEIYSLLTRWNPLNVKRPLPPAPSDGPRTVLVVGMGPAGYTLAHYLLNEGIRRCRHRRPQDRAAADGADGVAPMASAPRLIRSTWVSELYEPLDERIMAGFGGVAEYGITVRWDKNFLKLIYLSLDRRAHFRVYGGVRFGGTLTLDDAWRLGFDHVALATGAGRPTIIDMKNNLIRGVRKACDFLMALQLTGAAKRSSIANLQVRLPAVVIGGGLTAIDTATELLAYYPLQVEKILERYEALRREFGDERIWSMYDAEEHEILDEFLAHAEACRRERARAAEAREEPDFTPLVRSWGGVTIVYRKRLSDSPAYRLNHEEVDKALEEGIVFVENMSPVECVPDTHGAVKEVTFERQKKDEKGKWRGSGEIVPFPARSVLVAAGTSPNIIYEKEMAGHVPARREEQVLPELRAEVERKARAGADSN
ncbi:MAG: FAD-dependent oxidoreductase [Candidatus Manganitrophus sp.]|nr:MAG: FAD-dependent oxidoreductase [Candidatus Manganitrophus sp.]